MGIERTALVRGALLRLQACHARADEKIVIMADSGTMQEMVDAFMEAAYALGADPVLVAFAKRIIPWSELPEVVITAIKSADLAILLSTSAWAYTDSHASLTAPGNKVRLGQVSGGPEYLNAFLQMPPDDELIARVRHGADRLDAVNEIRITSRLGTNLTVRRGDMKKHPVVRQGVGATEPNQYSAVSGGWLAFAPPAETMQGTLAFVGAYNVIGPTKYYVMVDDPIRMEIQNGRIVKIHHDTGQARALDEWFGSFETPDSRLLAHLNFGLDHRAQIHNLDSSTLHALYGSIMIAFGTNYTPLFASATRILSHIDMTLTGATVYWDDQLIMLDGDYTPESGLRRPAGA